MEKFYKLKNFFLFPLFFFIFLDISFSKTENNNKNNLKIIPKEKRKELFSSFLIKNIFIIGETKYNHDFISNLSHIYPGDEIFIPSKKIDQAIKKLWKSNLFGKISIYKKNSSSLNSNEIDLFFDLEDLIEVDKINVKGTGIIKFFSIEKIKSGDKISENSIQIIKNDIKNYYIKKGYNEISIKNKWSIQNGKNILNIYVDKGKKIEIENILFDGNNYFSKEELLNFMVKIRKKFFVPMVGNSFYFSHENIKEDLKNILRKYQSMGFLDAQVFLDYIWKKNSGNYGIQIKIIEGDQYFLGDVNFVGNTFIKTNLLRKIFSYKKGDIYNKIGIHNNIFNSEYESSILSKYLNIGHLFVKIVPIEKRMENNKIYLEIKIEENKPVYINKVNISGNTTTKDHVIRRELTTYPGDLFSPQKIKYSMLRLVDLNLFDNSKIHPLIHQNKENNTIDIEWRIIEKNSNQIQIYGGYGGDELIGNFKLNFGNFSLSNFLKVKSWNPIPQGDGQKLFLFSKFSKDTKSYGFSFIEPWIEKTSPTSLSFHLNYSKKKIKKSENVFFLPRFFNSDTTVHEGFIDKIEMSLSLNKPLVILDPYSKIRLSMDYEALNYNTKLFSSHNRKLKYTNIKSLISLQRISNDPDLIFPFKGSELKLIGIFTPPYSILFRNTKRFKIYWMEFFKIKINTFWYKKIIDNLVIKVGNEFGFLGRYDKTKILFPIQRFHMGGDKNSFSSKIENIDHIPLRGYSSNRKNTENISTNDGGLIYNKSILEIRYLIKEFSNTSKFWSNIFIEGGNISDSYKKFNPLKMKKSFGIGFRIFLFPIGFFGIDICNPVDRKDFSIKSGWKTNFVIGKD
ncbi:BamA/OMP85 family outer membrane protein [Blattabacterium punctulatus]|uniref:BamA/OMP85 family outer membrane protein n=1 Tax=Blattabacterium punctulatus TaxID=164514 RepID=UPI001F2B4C9F|nr:POTRA domain-containing protein [Blattabacterium punctulatus]